VIKACHTFARERALAHDGIPSLVRCCSGVAQIGYAAGAGGNTATVANRAVVMEQSFTVCNLLWRSFQCGWLWNVQIGNLYCG